MAQSEQTLDRAPAASGGTSPPRVGGRFTRENAAYYGRRGAAARDRKFLERFRRPEEIRRAERAEFRWALAVVYQVFGSPRRPRRTLAHPEDRIEELREALPILGRNLDVGPTRDRLRAIDAIYNVWLHPRFLDPVFVRGNPFGIPLGVMLTDPGGPTEGPRRDQLATRAVRRVQARLQGLEHQAGRQAG
ncbi:MAG: hypothetical protein M3Q23_03625 [Actinomycetota bacterium]|nr:hypothetical protein [Actinomycetota bacterium]